MKSNTRSYGRARASRRARVCHPQVETMETRLPLGDALLSAWLGMWLLPPGPAADAATATAHAAPAPAPSTADAVPVGAPFMPELFLAREDPFEGAAPVFFATRGGLHLKPSWEADGALVPPGEDLSLPARAAARSADPGAAPAGRAAQEASGPVSPPAGQTGNLSSSFLAPSLHRAGIMAETALLATLPLPGPQVAPGRTGSERPNIVFIIADDMDLDGLQYMPRLQAVMADQGVSFSNMFVTLSMCCPSHVSILTGQYPHNHHILENNPPFGGWQRFHDLGGENSTAATWLQDAGYSTARFGKYLVGYPADSTYVPPGWDEWYVFVRGAYLNYTLNENGVLASYGGTPEDYSTDVLTAKVVDFIDRAEANDAQPFFAFLAPNAPHGHGVANGPALPAPRHAGMFAGRTAPRPPSFNEADMSDKPPLLQAVPLLTDERIAGIDHEYRTRIESLLALDESVETIVGALAEQGELENTYIFFTSDNGYHLGQHRLYNGKISIYEEDIRVPLIVRGPGVPAGVTRDQLALNIDFAPTFMELAGATAGRVMDGMSLLPLLGESPPPPHHWRQDFLVEIYRNPVGSVIGPNDIRALRGRDEIYAEWRITGERELYDLRADPYQLESQHDTAPPGHLRRLARRLAELATCAGDTCRE